MLKEDIVQKECSTNSWKIGERDMQGKNDLNTKLLLVYKSSLSFMTYF